MKKRRGELGGQFRPDAGVWPGEGSSGPRRAPLGARGGRHEGGQRERAQPDLDVGVDGAGKGEVVELDRLAVGALQQALARPELEDGPLGPLVEARGPGDGPRHGGVVLRGRGGAGGGEASRVSGCAIGYGATAVARMRISREGAESPAWAH